jgi:diaminopropionate ammonia-lyase family
VHVAGLGAFHTSLPNYSPTPLISLPNLATELRVRAVLVKDESNRFGLPSFKILGASWGVYKAVTSSLGLPSTVSLEELSKITTKTKTAPPISLFTATDGNHGRAVAFMAKALALDAHVFVPSSVDEHSRSQISGEGAHVHVVDGDYDLAVQEATRASSSSAADGGGILVQDTSFPGYEEIPSWIVEGYSTMLNEVQAQLADLELEATVMVTPVGVGSLAQAVALHCKSCPKPISVVAVEPDTAACLYSSLNAGKPVSVKTSSTIMDGMCCGTVSVNAWEYLRKFVDASIMVSCYESHCAVQYLASQSVMAGPCGAATLAGLRCLASSTQQTTVPLDSDAVVVLLNTEGPRSYPIPADVSIDDPVVLQTLTGI